jgi:hypothetical protein
LRLAALFSELFCFLRRVSDSQLPWANLLLFATQQVCVAVGIRRTFGVEVTWENLWPHPRRPERADIRFLRIAILLPPGTGLGRRAARRVKALDFKLSDSDNRPVPLQTFLTDRSAEPPPRV